MKKGKIVIAWIFLIILIILLVGLNYIKFFGSVEENYIEEVPVESSSSNAINTALQQIVDNFNDNEKIAQYESQNIKLKAVLNNYSVFVSYIDEVETTTYEFSYQDLNLTIKVADDAANIEKFEKVYEILIYAVQKRINNTEDIAIYVENFFDGSTQYDGLTRDIVDEMFVYEMNITKKLVGENSSDQVVTDEIVDESEEIVTGETSGEENSNDNLDNVVE